jgi:tRNA pseudouridine55 synthase
MAGSPHVGRKRERRHIDGVLLLDKPVGITSNAALQRVKRAFRAEKAGHTGTLDPLAGGLLPICLGEATKFSQGLTDATKSYRTDVRLGVTTESGDAEGRVMAERAVSCSREELERAIAGFRGDIMQIPHRFSALKRAGRALYEYARAGEAIEIAPRPIRIDELVIEAFDAPMVTLRVRCSKGTYVRSLAESIGEKVGCGGHGAALRRLSVGRLQVDRAVTLESLEAMPESDRDALLLPLTVLVEDLEQVALEPAEAARFLHGLPIRTDGTGRPASDSPVAVFEIDDSAHRFLGLAHRIERDGARLLAPARLLANRHEPAPEAVSGASEAGSLL